MTAQIDHQAMLDRLQEYFPQAVRQESGPDHIPVVGIPPACVLPVLSFLKEDPVLQMNFLTDLCGVHFPGRPGGALGVVYHLHSFVHNLRLRIKTFLPDSDPAVASVSSLFSAANWMERETYDFFGIRFDGHPDLRRILNVDDMDYFPLRKEYPLEDATRKDKDDRFFGREGHHGVEFDRRVDRKEN